MPLKAEGLANFGTLCIYARWPITVLAAEHHSPWAAACYAWTMLVGRSCVLPLSFLTGRR